MTLVDSFQLPPCTMLLPVAFSHGALSPELRPSVTPASFWKRLSRLMSKVNPEPNVIHIMGCYILGNPNGEKLFQNLRTLMTPYKVTFESPLELSAQGKQMIETYFDFRLYRLWKSRQHSKLLDFDDVL